MKIKERFMLISGAPNILDLSKAQIEGMVLEENSPKHVFATLELKKSMIKHDGREKILEYVKNLKTTKDLDVLVFEQYPLVTSYNRKTHSKIINLSPFNTKELSRISHMNLYASILYAYTFESLVNGKLRIPDNFTQPISNFWFSLFVQLFGRDYGLTGAYSSRLTGLKFLITLYILVSFFGRQQQKPTYTLAKQYSGYSYEDKVDILNKIDFNSIHGLTKSLNQLEIMPGFNIVKFTTKMNNILNVQMLPMFEDLSRFLSLIMTSSVLGQTISKPFINKYNQKAYIHMLNYMKKRLF